MLYKKLRRTIGVDVLCRSRLSICLLGALKYFINEFVLKRITSESDLNEVHYELHYRILVSVFIAEGIR